MDQAAALSGGQVSVSAVTTIAAVDSNNCAGGAGPHAMFLQVRVTNTSGGALSGLTATLNGFPASAPVPPSPPTAFTLDLGETTSRSIGTLANGASASLYWYVNYPCTLPPTVGSSITYTVTIGDSIPGTVMSGNLTLTTLSELSAAAGGDVASALVGAGAVVGQVLKVTVNYAFGNPAATAAAMIQPAGNVSFDASCFRLVSSDITASTFTGGPVTTADNTLYFPSGVNGGSSNTLTVDYYFKALCSGPGTTIFPFADLTSGGQVKYTSNFGLTCSSTPCDQTLPAPTNPLTISKSAMPNALAAGGSVTYTITVTNSNITFAASVDRIDDVLPAGVTFSAISMGSGVTAANSTLLPAMGSGGAISFVAQPPLPPANPNYFVPAGGSLQLIYTASVSSTAGTYTNSVSAVAGSASVGPATSDVFVGPTRTGTATVTPTATATGTATHTATPTATATGTATGIATPTATATGTATLTATATGTATATATGTATATQTATATATGTATATRTTTPTATATPTPTLLAPVIDGGVEPGDNDLIGIAESCDEVRICLIGTGTMPSVPPCSPPDTVLGSGSSLPNGNFDISITPPLEANQCVYPYDSCNMLVGRPVCARLPAPAPALSPRGFMAALAALALVGFLALVRLRRVR